MSDQPGPPTPTQGDQPAATPPLELPASGGSTPTQRLAGDHGSSLTLAQAAARSGLSISTWRRRIKAGKAAGAYLAPSPMGDEWRIPVATVEAAAIEGGRVGMTRQGGDPGEAVELRARVAELEQQLAVQRALADERRAMLDQLHATVRALGVGDGQGDAPSGATSRKWWGGKRKK